MKYGMKESKYNIWTHIAWFKVGLCIVVDNMSKTPRIKVNFASFSSFSNNNNFLCSLYFFPVLEGLSCD